MSDIPPVSLPLPELPNEVLLGIFHLADASTILNACCTSHYWRAKLNSYEFVSIIAESVEDGIFCIRYSSMGRKSYLLAWNPISRRSKIIQDPVCVFKPDMVYLYAFMYYPYTLDYAIMHVFKHSSESTTCTLAIYTSFTRDWHVVMTCPPYVQTIDATYVTLDGCIYWVTYSHKDVERTKPYIVCFSILSNTFQQIFVLEQALAHCYMLIIFNQKLCLAASDHDEKVFHISIWHVHVIEEDPTWTRLFMYNGIGSLFTPTMFVDEDIIEIKETHFETEGAYESHFSHFHIC
ncbi:hypothetical protein HN51_060505 [Arachis hypogaea]|uniref:F-box domain-containing protein n=1 Tax=Arachis hypogaea TaxID=3818 RepID=A0A444X9Z5_ARAHY|nr:hypothetical protein Ahy_B10g106171 [Arachis hypogaea]